MNFAEAGRAIALDSPVTTAPLQQLCKAADSLCDQRVNEAGNPNVQVLR